MLLHGTSATMIRDLTTAIIRDGKVPIDWEQSHESFIACHYKGRGDALDRHLSQCMRFQTVWYVRPAKPEISLSICAV